MPEQSASIQPEDAERFARYLESLDLATVSADDPDYLQAKIAFLKLKEAGALK
jgi:tetrahydromethanopterin S-methyltransferase subunit A